jgi:hypothetical protein
VRKWVDFYKSHRAILDSDIIHVRRPDVRDLDCILHVNPGLKTKGLALVFNPLDHAVKRELRLPLYYTGLTRAATIREGEGKKREYRLDRQYHVTLELQIPSRSTRWLAVE